MGLIDSIGNSIRQKDKEIKLKRRKRRQNKKQKEAKKAGDTKAVQRYSTKKKQTNKKRSKAQKSFTSSAVQSGVGLVKAGIHAYAGDPAGVALEFI